MKPLNLQYFFHSKLGEPQFLESMQLKYNDLAEQKGVFVVGSCGFDSIPSDMGGVALHKAMEGPVNKVTNYNRSHLIMTNYIDKFLKYLLFLRFKTIVELRKLYIRQI